MPRTRPHLFLLGGLALLALLPGRAASAPGCAGGYAYAGFQSARTASGAAASLSAQSAPQVTGGHAAAWVGVGGPGAGPGGTDEWLQVGLSAFPGTGNSLYYEVAVPGKAPRYVQLLRSVAPGESHRVAVLEMHARPAHWRVWIDGRAVSDPILLAGSHGAWAPIATAESWGGGESACNRFAYEFGAVRIASRVGGVWRGFRPGPRFLDHGFELVRHGRGSFLAAFRKA